MLEDAKKELDLTEPTKLLVKHKVGPASRCTPSCSKSWT